MYLSIEGVSKHYPSGVHALRNVTLDIPSGIFGLLGPGGAGKTTLMRTLATLQTPDCGSVRLCDVDAVRTRDDMHNTLGYLPQEFGVYPRATAESLLSYFATLKGIMDRRARNATVDALLNELDLWEARHEKLGNVSRSVRQRFGLAVALLGNPRVIILDEPTSGLDAVERARFVDLLTGLGADRVVVLATQAVEDVSDACTHMAIIDRGEIVLEAETMPSAKLKDVYFRALAGHVPVPAAVHQQAA